MEEKRFNNLVAIIIAVLTMLTALLTYLQSDASARDDRANRDTKRYTLQALGEKVSGDARVNYDYNTAYQNWFELDLLAESASARGDEQAAQRYQTVRDQMLDLSPLLQNPYRDAATGDVDISKYETDVYVTNVAVLTENYLAASRVKDAWDSKANTYIVHLTLLAVALFLFGLAATIAGSQTRWVFAGTGSVFALIAIVWAGVTWAKPVPDLREAGNAIQSYANGVGLAYQEKWTEAVQAFDQAIQASPDYTNAFAARAEAYASLGELDKSIADYEKARALGDASANTAGMLAWQYYLNGQLDQAAAMNQTALRSSPDELWIQYDLGLSLLAAGKFDQAAQAYQTGMDSASKQVADAKAAGQEPPSYLWWGLDDAATSLQSLVDELDVQNESPLSSSVSDPDPVKQAAGGLIQQIKSLSVALEYTGKPPMGELTAKVTDFVFLNPQYDEQGNEIDPVIDSAFESGVSDVRVQFDYEGIQPGQELVVKVYLNDVEEPSWRMVDTVQESSGTLEIPISMAYTESFVLADGAYQVDLYVDGHLAQTGWFSIGQE